MITPTPSFAVSQNSVSPASRNDLSRVLLASARHVQGVLAGRSLSELLADTPGPVRPAAQAISFHAMRRLGLAMALRNQLLRGAPPGPLFDGLLLVSLALLDTAAALAADPQAEAPRRTAEPRYQVHTVVDQAVNAAAGYRKLAGFRGLLNACLRRFLRERQGLLDAALQTPEGRYNHPAWWVQRLQKAYPEQWEALLEAANQPPPMVLRVNRRRCDRDTLLAQLTQHGTPAWPVQEAAVVLASPRPVHEIPGFAEGWWSVQDLSAQQAGRLLPVRDGDYVLDACAAPGGKTAHLLERASLRLLALDADAARLARVGETLDRLGLSGPHVTLQCADAGALDTWWNGESFDAVLADVPCTASGVVRRHPDIRWLRRQADIGRTASVQRRLLDALWKTVRPGGHLLYATCSFFPEEGEQQVQAFVQRTTDAVRLDAPGQILPLAQAQSADAVTGDGFFYALFVKRA